MHITFVMPEVAREGGVRVVAVYAQHLIERGHTVTVVSQPHTVRSWRQRVKRGLSGKGFSRVLPAPGSFIDDVDGIDHRVLRPGRGVTDADVPEGDVVVATWWATALPVSRLSAGKGAKAYLVQHDERVFRPYDSAFVAGVEASWRLPLSKAAVAGWIARTVERGGGGPVEVVLNGVDIERFEAPERGKQRRPTVGLVYAPVRFKGVDVMLEACRRARAELEARGLGLEVVAFGRGEPVAELPLLEGTRYVQDPSPGAMPGLYASCDAWLFGSRSEGFGLPLLEAMACRTPVIATPTGAAPELAEPGGGWLVEVEDAAAMAGAIVEAGTMTDNHWRARSAAARALAERHTWAASAAQFERWLEKLAGCGAGR